MCSCGAFGEKPFTFPLQTCEGSSDSFGPAEAASMFPSWGSTLVLAAVVPDCLAKLATVDVDLKATILFFYCSEY